MKNECRVSSVEPPSPCFGAPGCRVRPRAGLRRSSFVIRHFQKAFTLIELLTVIAIIGILAALLAPVLKNFSKPDVTVAATRQMLDDMARARQLAISQRTTVFMVFVHSNFWTDPLRQSGPDEWAAMANPSVAPLIATSTTVTQMYGAPLNGYMIVSLRGVGDQPGRFYPKDLLRVKTLPSGAFISPLKFYDALPYPFTPAYPTNRPDLPIYRFLRTNAIPFPTSDLTTNVAFMNQYNNGTINFVTVPYIAFNYLGQLTSGDGTVLPYDENIPLDYGSIAVPRNLSNKLPMQGPLSVIESPPGNSTNSAYNVIHIDRITGRARLERQDQL
jgi:prepilin-type N-terminal cleavage/methylation domain-containing protein